MSTPTQVSLGGVRTKAPDTIVLSEPAATKVAELLAARMPITFQLGLMAMIVALTIALPIGIYSAIRQDTAGDYLTLDMTSDPGQLVDQALGYVEELAS